MTDRPCSAVERQCKLSVLPAIQSALRPGLPTADQSRSSVLGRRIREKSAESATQPPSLAQGDGWQPRSWRSETVTAQTPSPPSTDWYLSRAASYLDSAGQRPSAAPAGKSMDLRIRENQL